MRVAITGTTGYLGRYVVESLLEAGHTVAAQVRRPLDTSDPLSQCDGRLKLVVGNMEDISSLETLVEGCNAVVHMAFMSKTGSYRGGEGDNPAWFWEQNFGGTLRLLQACQAANVKKFIFLSSRAVFDGCHITSRLVKDMDEPLPNNHYGLLKLASEQLAGLYTDTTFCSLRATGIYGLTWPLTRTKWWDLVSDQQILDRDLSSVSDYVVTEVHGIDVASAVLLLLQQENWLIRGRVFNCSDILVSEQYLVQQCQSIFTNRSNVPTNLQLQPPRNNLGTAGLDELGWRGGGVQRLQETLLEIKDASEQLQQRT